MRVALGLPLRRAGEPRPAAIPAYRWRGCGMGGKPRCPRSGPAGCRRLGISGVPYVVISREGGGACRALSGAQSVRALRAALAEAAGC